MALTNFRTYVLAVELHKACKKIQVKAYIKDQLVRASSSVALNLAEGSAKPSAADRRRYYNIAYGSLREVQALADLEGESFGHLADKLDHLGACLYKLTRY